MNSNLPNRNLNRSQTNEPVQKPINLVNRLRKLPLIDKDEQSTIIQEFVDGKYFKNCEFENYVDTILFYLLNYALSLDELISANLTELFKDLFSHSNHCFHITKNRDHSCKISFKLFHSNWFKVYFESVCKVYDYNFNAMSNQLVDLMFVLFKKSPNRAAINLEFVPLIDILINNTQTSLIKSSEVKNKDKTKYLDKKELLKDEKKRKVVLLFILILDGQYQSFISRKEMRNAASFLDAADIRMHWENLKGFKDIKARVQSIFQFCRTLVAAKVDQSKN